MTEKKLKVTEAPGLEPLHESSWLPGGSWRTVGEEQPADLCRDAEMLGVSEPGHHLPQLLRQLSVVLHQPPEHGPRQVEGRVELRLRTNQKRPRGQLTPLARGGRKP